VSLRVFNVSLRLPILLLVVTEGVILVLAAHLGAWTSGGVLSGGFGQGARTHPTAAVVFATLSVLSLMAVGLYSTRQRCDFVGLAIRVAAAVTGAALLSALIYYAAPGIAPGRGALLSTTVVAFAGVLALRSWTNRHAESGIFKRRVLVLGAGSQAAKILDLRRQADARGFRVVAFVAAQGDEVAIPHERLAPRPPDLFLWAQENSIDDVVVAVSDRRRDFPMDELLECRLAGIDVLELPSFLERETAKVWLDVMSPSWIVLGDGFRRSWLHLALKRAFDIVVSIALLVPSALAILLAVVAIWIEDGVRAPILYRQRRIGRYNQPFELFKLRSMRENAEAEGAIWAAQDDPRITKVGSFIRRLRIDEIPQLFNVFRGDMSFVGPRPERPEFVEHLAKAIPYYRGRHAVKPGITGWAQLCYPYGSSESDAKEKLQYDLYYVKNRSVFMDLSIVIQTVEVILWRKGAR